MACNALYQYEAAREAFAKGLSLDPANRELAAKTKEAEGQARYDLACRLAHAKLQRRDLIFKLRAVSAIKEVPHGGL